jgi:glycosyltransferase involved in cell wall biosynthesis
VKPAGQVGYLCLQTTRQGQASYAHVHEIIKGLETLDCPVRLWEPPAKTGVLAKVFSFARLELDLIFHLRQLRLLYVRGHFCCLPVSMMARLLRVPVIQELNGMYSDAVAVYPWTKRLLPMISLFMDRQLAWANAVVTVTPQFQTWVRRRVPSQKNVVIISNGADVNRFHPEAQALFGLPRKYALFFGALSPWQGLDLLLEAVNSDDWPRGITLVVAGDGGGRKLIEEAASEGKLRYLGRVPYNDIPGLVANSFCSLIPKVDEGLGYAETGLAPLKLFESMACGVPVVVTDFPGMADIVRRENCGVVIPQKDGKALARAVAKLSAEPELSGEMGARSRSAAVRQHSWAGKARETFDLIQQVLSSGSQ